MDYDDVPRATPPGTVVRLSQYQSVCYRNGMPAVRHYIWTSGKRRGMMTYPGPGLSLYWRMARWFLTTVTGRKTQMEQMIAQRRWN
jgi:hypothetical protein